MESLQELDLRRNLIGDLGALIVLDSLRLRKEGVWLTIHLQLRYGIYRIFNYVDDLNCRLQLKCLLNTPLFWPSL